MQADENAPVFGAGGIEVAADPETVWRVMADLPRWPEWNSDITAATIKTAIDTGLARLKAEAEPRATS